MDADLGTWVAEDLKDGTDLSELLKSGVFG